jgi:hypothetical protein
MQTKETNHSMNKYHEDDHAEGTDFHPLDEQLMDEDRIDENSVYVSIRWTPKSGVYRPDGRRLRGKFKVKRIQKMSDGKYLIILNNGIGIKVHPGLPLDKQGFKFKMQHTQPLSLDQAYKYLNGINDMSIQQLTTTVPATASGAPVIQKEGVFFEKFEASNKIKTILSSDSGYFKVIMESGAFMLLDPDKELENRNFQFYSRTGRKINILEAVIAHFDIPIVETLTGFIVEEQFLSENINEANPIRWAADKLKKGVEWLKDRPVRKAAKAEQRDVGNIARLIWTDWAKFAAGANLQATPENIMNFLQHEGFTTDVLNTVAAASKKNLGIILPKIAAAAQAAAPAAPATAGMTTAPNAATSAPATAATTPGPTAADYQSMFKKAVTNWKDINQLTGGVTNIADLDADKLDEIKTRTKSFVQQYEPKKQEYQAAVSSGKIQNDPETDAAIGHLDKKITLAKAKNLVEKHILEAAPAKQPVLSNNDLKKLFINVVQASKAKRAPIPAKYTIVEPTPQTIPAAQRQGGWGRDTSASPADERDYEEDPLAASPQYGAQRRAPRQGTGQPTQQAPGVNKKEIYDNILKNSAQVGGVNYRAARDAAARLVDIRNLKEVTRRDLEALAKLGWGLYHYMQAQEEE